MAASRGRALSWRRCVHASFHSRAKFQHIDSSAFMVLNAPIVNVYCATSIAAAF